MVALFHKQGIATIEEMNAAVGMDVEMIMLRKLRALGHLSSRASQPA